MTNVCHSQLVLAGMVDEAEATYVRHAVGDDEEVCLGRARHNWLFCKNMQTQPVAMLFLPTGETSSFPPSAVVEEAHRRILDSTAIVYTGIFGARSAGGRQYDPLPTVVRQSVSTQFSLFSDQDYASEHAEPPHLHETLYSHHSADLEAWVPMEPRMNLELPQKLIVGVSQR